MAAGSSSQMLGWLAMSAGTVILYAAYKGRSPLSVVQNTLNPSVPVRDLPAFAPVPELLPLPAGHQLPSYGPRSSGYIPAVPGAPGPAPAGGGNPNTPGSIRGLKPHVVAARTELAARFRFSSIGGFNYRNIANTSTLSDHAFGLALDLMTLDKAVRFASADYLVQHAGRLRVKYVIRDRQIWSIERQREGWRNMGDRGNPTQNHEDHVHVSFLA